MGMGRWTMNERSAHTHTRKKTEQRNERFYEMRIFWKIIIMEEAALSIWYGKYTLCAFKNIQFCIYIFICSQWIERFGSSLFFLIARIINSYIERYAHISWCRRAFARVKICYYVCDSPRNEWDEGSEKRSCVEEDMQKMK